MRSCQMRPATCVVNIDQIRPRDPRALREHLMRLSLRCLFALVAVAAVCCLLASKRAPDFWNYGKLGVSNGTANSPVYYVEVCGVGDTPTVARIVRFPIHAAAPHNALEVGQAASDKIRARVRFVDRWNRTFTIIAGRSIDETIEIRLDGSTAQRVFARPGTRFKDFSGCEAFWKEVIEPCLPDVARRQRAVDRIEPQRT